MDPESLQKKKKKKYRSRSYKGIQSIPKKKSVGPSQRNLCFALSFITISFCLFIYYLLASTLKEPTFYQESAGTDCSVLTPELASNNSNSTHSCPKPLLFIHLAKTGGTSLRAALEKAVPVCYFPGIPSSQKTLMLMARHKNSCFKKPLTVLMGHLVWGFHRWFDGQTLPLQQKKSVNDSACYLTMLREPVERVWSHYNYHLNNPKDVNHFWAVNTTLKDWLKLVPFGKNQMTAMLGGFHATAVWYTAAPAPPEFFQAPKNGSKPSSLVSNSEVESRFDALMHKLNVSLDSHFSVDRKRAFLEMAGQLSTPPKKGKTPSVFPNTRYDISYQMYLTARTNLESFYWIGLQENFTESLRQLSGILQVPKLAIRSKNVYHQKQERLPTAEEVELIKAYNKWDILLYSYAVERFAQQVGKCSPFIEGNVTVDSELDEPQSTPTAPSSSSRDPSPSPQLLFNPFVARSQ